MSDRTRTVLQCVLTALVLLAGVYASWYAYALAHFDGSRGVRIFYDQFHVARHTVEGENKRGAWAYHEVSGYHDFRQALERAGYEVHVHRSGRITPGMLDDYDVFFIGEQTHHATMMTPAERDVLFDWIRAGGGMWATIEHTNAHGMTDHWNPWMEGTGIQARYDSICELNGTVDSRDWVRLEPTDHPVMEGVDAVFTCNGCSFDTEHGIAFSSATSWSDAWNEDDPPVQNGDNRRQAHELAGPLAGLAAVEYGEGRIVTTCDHNLFSNPTFYTRGHHRLLFNAMDWLAGDTPHRSPDGLRLGLGLGLVVALAAGAIALKAPWYAVLAAVVLGGIGGAGQAWNALTERGVDLLFVDAYGPDQRVRSKDPHDLFTFYEHVMKDPETRAWLEPELLPGYDAVFLPAPTEALPDADLATVRSYLSEGRSVVYLASQRSLRSPAGAQLLGEFGVHVELSPSEQRSARAFAVRGDPELVGGVERMRVPPGVGLASISGDGVEVAVYLENGEVGRTDLVGWRSVDGGRFVVLAQSDLLGNTHIRKKKYRMSVVDLSMHLSEWLTGS